MAMHKTKTTPKTVFIVEDDADIGAFLLEAFAQETAGYTPILMTDSLQALELASAVHPALLIVNYQLPHLNGIELYDRLQAEAGFADVPTIMISASLPKQAAAARGIISLDKPIDLDDFLKMVTQLLQ